MPGASVLVVDDDPAIMALVRATLEDEHYRVLSAVDGDALEMACRHRPTVVVLDLSMPQMDGAEVSRRLRADPATAHLPIILMSAQYDLRGLAADLPVNERLTKPFDLDHLLALIAKWETVTAGAYLSWRVSAERSFAFDRRTRRVIAWCLRDSADRWWALIRRPSQTYGPFETAVQARQEVARQLRSGAQP